MCTNNSDKRFINDLISLNDFTCLDSKSLILSKRNPLTNSFIELSHLTDITRNTCWSITTIRYTI